MIADIKNRIKEPATKEELQNYVDCHIGLEYSYTNPNSTKSYSISLSPNELEDIMTSSNIP